MPLGRGKIIRYQGAKVEMIYEGWLYAGVKHGIGRKIEINSDHIQVSEGKYVLDQLIEGKITEYDILKKEKIAERKGRF